MKKSILSIIVLLLGGCSKNDRKLDSAIAASREGLALIKESQVEEGRQSLLEAKKYYEELVASEPENGLYNNNYGWVLMKLGEYNQARICLEKAKQYKSSVHPSSAPEENLKEVSTLESHPNEVH